MRRLLSRLVDRFFEWSLQRQANKLFKGRKQMDRSYSWQEIANLPLCCMCCGSRNVIAEKNLCLDCRSDKGLWADERKETDKEKINE